MALSEYQWHKTSIGSYVLLLRDGDYCVLTQTLLGWDIDGKVNKYQIHEHKPTFEGAVKEGDLQVFLCGGKAFMNAAKRQLKKDAEPPTPAQLSWCRVHNVKVPPGTTFGDIRRRINVEAMKIKQRRGFKV